MKISKYPDGTSYVKTDTELIGNINYEFIHKINSYEDLWYLNQRVDAFYNLNKQKPTVIIPNLIDAQADRRFNVGESSGLKLVCKFLNGMNANFKIFHPHNPEVVEALMNNVEIIDNKSFIFRVLNSLDDLGIKYLSNLVILLPDGGAYKWGVKLMDKIGWQGDVLAAAKNRQFKDGKSVPTQQLPDFDFGCKDILIIDDICVYGGTFKGLAKLLKEKNCGKLYLAVSHMTVQNLGEDPVTNYFDTVFCSNSKFDEYFIQNHPDISTNPQNLKIIKLF